MDCPKCKAAFETFSHHGMVVARCTRCAGLWFDTLDKDDLQRIEGSEVIDIGHEQVGADYNRIRDIDCPACGQHMIPMVDKDQVHIQYEACPGCYGTFFDAGEFRDLKEYTVLERFRDMLATLRSNF